MQRCSKQLGPDAVSQQHRLFQQIAQYADPASGVVRLSVLSRSFVLLASPAAQASLRKQAPFLPKPPAQMLLKFLVRTCKQHRPLRSYRSAAVRM
jgi:hypothetical protein